MKHSMKYISYYCTRESDRYYFLSAVGKQDYLIGALERVGYNVDVVSRCITHGSKYSKGWVKPLFSHSKLIMFPSLPWGNKVQKLISLIFAKFCLLNYLLQHGKTHETILVYHAAEPPFVLSLVKKIKKCYIILEVEEIYSDVTGSAKLRKWESRAFALADGFVFPTNLLDEKINTDNKPSIIVHGTYQVEKSRQNSDKKQDVITHVLYAGTLDPRKGGAAAAAATAAFLPESYHIHILGFGSDVQVKNIKKTIKNSSLQGHARVTYDGVLSGEDYIKFVQSCDIGLSTQNPNAAFNTTSFPSKILSYLSNGLHVVSIRIPTIEQSAIGDMLFYYDEQTPECIANAIEKIDLQQPYDSRTRLQKLDKQFALDLQTLLKG